MYEDVPITDCNQLYSIYLSLDVIGLGSTFLLALIFLILSGALYGTYWGLFVRTWRLSTKIAVLCLNLKLMAILVLPYFLIPLLGALCPAIAGDDDSSR